MPSFILDTHSLLWWHEEDPQLSETAKGTIRNPENILIVSIVSFWEIAIKEGIKKLKLEYTINDLAVACLKNNIQIFPVRLYHISQYSLLPLIHKDPFDRMIVATAYSDKLTLISKDRQLSAYNIEVIW
jgi:PIN domain nuclease of toxin-antitoxin system